MSGNYPAGVTDSHPYFNDGEGQPDANRQAELELWQREAQKEQGQREAEHSPDCRCEECECPY